MNKLFRTITVRQEKNSVVPLHSTKDVEHKIVIEAMEVMMSIGVLPEEKQSKQRVIIDIEVSIEPKTNYQDDIVNTLSYVDIIEDTKTMISNRHFDLVETVAAEISDLCLKHHQAMKVSVSIKKPDIIKDIQSVGFSMVKEKNA